ncbi:hypothetical protein ILUMI_02115 [Ignelater luminosus]|uniref:Uncharacterized protein n=1 Tax=Ignelater luminosus TaxID=2038154 RepID=A0A8K0DIU8_IGNLU|nr:hypothetical protein ILUMI_02115 [Ignelater luminosus]
MESDKKARTVERRAFTKLPDRVTELKKEQRDVIDIQANILEIEVQNVLKVVDASVHDDLNDGANSMHSSRSIQGSRQKFKLPEIELKKSDDDELASEDKFQYLIQATVEGSRVHDYVNSFPLSVISYKKVIEGLKNRFGRE